MKRNLLAAGYWDAVDVTNAILTAYGIQSPPVDVEALCRRYKLHIDVRPVWPNRAHLSRKTIVISPMSANRQRFYLAHELGHYLLPANYHDFSMNTFAACLLIPHPWLMRDLPVRSIAALSDKYGVTYPVMKLRLRQIGLESRVTQPF